MRRSSKLLSLFLTGTLALMFCWAGSALAQSEDSELRTTKHILGPVTIGSELGLKICMSDVAGIAGAAEKSRGEDRSRVQTKIVLFDSKNPTKPLADVDGDDFLVWQRGYGACVNVGTKYINGVYVAAGDFDGDRHSLNIRDGLSNTAIIAVLVSITEGSSVFQPIATGQLINPQNTSEVGLLLPAVQAARE